MTLNRFILVGLILSFTLHFATGVYVYLSDGHQPIETIEITLIDESQKDLLKQRDLRQIVDQSEKRINDEIDEKAKYLSRYNQKVIEQTRAQQTGQFQNNAGQGLAPQSNRPANPQKNRDRQMPTENEKRLGKTDIQNGTVALPKLAQLKPQFQWDKLRPTGVQNPGTVSQTDDYLKDEKSGPQTLLSTREFVYFTYYSRIKDRLRIFWEPKIREKVQRIFSTGRTLASDQERITRLVITLDANGKLVRVQVLNESGLKDLDDAAIEAFQAAAPFPNPPKGIVDSDGTIKIHWDFILGA
ncbi:MAG: energy transducer TonB [Oligoflexia bacterium]|nr:energy transducer TonB [Oligoflexia bacterium]